MQVAIDTSALYTTRAGVARYLRGLLGGFDELKPAGLQIAPLAWEVENFEYRQPSRAFKTAFRELVWGPWIAPRQLRRLQPALLHSSSSILIHAPSNLRQTASLMDLAVLRHPERFRPWLRHGIHKSYQLMKSMERVICISRFTADEAMALLEIPAKKLEVTLLGCDFTRSEQAEQPPEITIPPEFFLFVGSLEPGKNLALLRQAYELSEREGKPLPPLVIVGARWAGVASEGAPPAGWKYLGHVPDSTLCWLYRRAAALLFPSKYEGFGFPVLEAMTLGCPVICSRVASLPEVGGDAVCYAALDPNDYLTKMRALLANPEWRASLKERGFLQAVRFSWKRCAGETADIFRSVLHSA